MQKETFNESVVNLLGIGSGFFWALLGAVLGCAVTTFIEARRQPKITVRIGEPNPLNAQMTFLAIEVLNVNYCGKWKFISRYFGRNAATECSGRIKFTNLDSGVPLKKEMPIRWSETEHPYPSTLIDSTGNAIGVIQDRIRFLAERLTLIYAGHLKRSGIIVKFTGEQECYGWNNDSYLIIPPNSSPQPLTPISFNRKNPEWKLDEGVYSLEITIEHRAGLHVETLYLINDTSGFRLTYLNPRPRCVSHPL